MADANEPTGVPRLRPARFEPPTIAPFVYDPALYTETELAALRNMEEFASEMAKLCTLYYGTKAEKSTHALMQLKCSVTVLNVRYLRHVERKLPGRMLTRQALTDTAHAVGSLRIPPTLSAKRDEIEALRARLVELAAAAPE